ncbi:MAG: GHKL domain-containing protein, partial [Bacilli bacterium]|nr:GHKL domain-containing protein [Bacilli bacterium]
NKTKFNNKTRLIVYILVVAILNTLIYLYTTGSTKTILTCILYILTFKELFKLELSKAIFIGIVYVILLLIPDLLTLGGALYIFNVSKEYYYTEMAGGIICNISVNTLMIIITYILRKPLRKLINYKISTNKKIIVICVLTLISLAIFFYNLINTFEFNNNIIGYLIVIMTLILILFYLFKQKIDNDIVVKKYDELLDIMKAYENDIEEQRTLIHETKNELATIKCKLNDKEETETIIKYIDSVIGDKVSTNMSKYSKFKNLPSNGIKGFFYYKFMKAEREGIDVSVNISKQIEESYIKELDTKTFKDLVRIIGVYLDNAIEASIESEEKKLGIEIYLINKEVKIIISNTYNRIDTEKVGKERYTTKGKNRGHGLLLVKKILHESERIESETEIKEELFIQKLKIKK